MIDGIHIFDDIISNEKQDILEGHFKNSNVVWSNGDNNQLSQYPFPQDVIVSNNVKNEKIESIISDIENSALIRLNKQKLDTYRYKINKLKITDYSESRNDMESIHIDRYESHVSMVYYINDTDGNTKFYKLNDGTITKWVDYIKNKEFNRFSEIKSVSPKKGRVVVFNGMIPHHSSYPTISDRYVINFNTVIKPTTKSLF